MSENNELKENIVDIPNENEFAPWKEYPRIWKSKACWFTWLRGLLRKGWSKSPIKIEFIRTVRKRIKTEKGREIWGGECNTCKKDFPAKMMNVDHIIDAGSLNDVSDITPFVMHLLMCPKSNLQYVCVNCHKIKSHADKKGISLELSGAEKTAIKIIKHKQDKEWIVQHGMIPESNAKKRREQIVKYLLENE